MKKIVVVNGIHSSGKNSLARLLAKDSVFAYFPEIGEQLRRSVGSNALRSGEEFDREVMRRELERDEEIAACPQVPLVETWHIGNLAYVHARNPRLEDAYRIQLGERLKRFSVSVLLMDINWDTFRARATEKIKPSEMDELMSLYAKVLDTIYNLCSEYHIPRVTIRNEGRIDEAATSAQEFLFSQGLHL